MSLPFSVEEFFDDLAEAERLAAVYLPFLAAGFKQGAENVLLGRRARGDGYDDLVREQLRRKSFDHATLAVGTTKRKLQDILRKALDEGWGVEELGRGIREEFDGMARVRGLRIARTELTDTINDGSNQTLRVEGYEEKEWSAVIDGQERPDHHAASGQTVGIHDTFRVGGESARYPGDESLSPGQRVNCRCLIVGAGLSDDRKRQVGRRFLRSHGALERRFVVHLRGAFVAQRDRVLSHFPAP